MPLVWSAAVSMLLLLLSPLNTSAFLIKIPSHSEQCFMESATKVCSIPDSWIRAAEWHHHAQCTNESLFAALQGDKIAGNVRVISGGSLDIDVKVNEKSSRGN
jgi:hypothetical protein